jgi:hypothetical protein
MLTARNHGREDAQDALFEAPAQNTDLIKSQRQLARALKIDRETLRRYWGEPGRPDKNADGYYSIREFKEWLETCDFADKGEFGAERAKHWKLRNEKLSRELEKDKGLFIAVGDHLAIIETIANIYETTLKNIPRQISLLTTDEIIRERVLKVILDARDQLQRHIAEERSKVSSE